MPGKCPTTELRPSPLFSFCLRPWIGDLPVPVSGVAGITGCATALTGLLSSLSPPHPHFSSQINISPHGPDEPNYGSFCPLSVRMAGGHHHGLSDMDPLSFGWWVSDQRHAAITGQRGEAMS